MRCKRLRSRRGGMFARAMFLSAGVILLVAAALAVFFYLSHEEAKTKNVGKVGHQSTQQVRRRTGINLPIAEKAAEGASSPETTVEVPVQWGKNLAAAEGKLAERYAAVAAGLVLPPDATTFDEAVTLKVDRDLEYRSLVQAVLAGRKKGFVRFHIACLRKATEEDVGYLRIELPVELLLGKRELRFRLVKGKEDEKIRYVFGIRKTREYDRLADATIVMKNTTAKGRDRLLVIDPTLSLSVQNVVEALNAATYAGFERITFAQPPKLY